MKIMRKLLSAIGFSLVSLFSVNSLNSEELKTLKYDDDKCYVKYEPDEVNNSYKIFEAVCKGDSLYMLRNPDGDDKIDAIFSKVGEFNYSRKYCSEGKLKEAYFDIYNKKIMPGGEIFEIISKHEIDSKIDKLSKELEEKEFK